MVSEKARLITNTFTAPGSVGRIRKHSKVNHSAGEQVGTKSGTRISTNSAETYFAILKGRNYGVYHDSGRRYMPQFLKEFDWRYNVRSLRGVERAAAALKMTGGERLLLKSPASE